MKTKLIVTALAIMVASAGFAQKRAALNIAPQGEDQVVVNFAAEKAAPLELSLTDENGNIMYYSKTEKEVTSLKKVFDFSEIKDGEFQVSLNYGNHTFSRSLDVKRDQVAVGDEVCTVAPWFSYENDKLIVSCLNPSLKNVYMTVYQNGQPVTSSKLGKELAIHKCFDLSKLEDGSYDIVLSEKNGDYVYSVNK